MPKVLPKGFKLDRFFGDHFYDFKRMGGERAQQILDLVEERRAKSQCDVCGMPTGTPPNNPKEYIGAYICDYCRRGLQSKR